MRSLAAGLFAFFAFVTPAWADDPGAVRGRENETTTAEALAWIPRVILSPLSFVSEYIVREPADAVADWMSRDHVVEFVDQVILHPKPNIAWYPIVELDVGVLAAAGATVTFKDLFTTGHTLKLLSVLGGPDYWRGNVRDAWKVGKVELALDGSGFTRSNVTFNGFGPETSPNGAYFRQTHVQGFGSTAFEPSHHLRVAASAGFRADWTGPGASPSVEQEVRTSTIPGWGETDLAMAMLDLRLDSRPDRDTPSGARLVSNVTYGHDVADAQRKFVLGTVDAQAAVEISKPFRVLTVRGYLADSAPLGSEPVPFLEQPTLGGTTHFGFFWNRFRDESAVMLELRYRYPVGYFVDMEWIASVGNVFARDFSDFDVKELTGSFSVGFRTRRTGLIPFQMLFGVGTNRFDEAFGVQSIRFYLSTTEDL